MILVEMSKKYVNFLGTREIKEVYAFDLYDSEKNKHRHIKAEELNPDKLSAGERKALLLFMRDLIIKEA